MPKGTSLRQQATLPDVIAALAAGLGDANFQPFGTSYGDQGDGSPVGARDAVLSIVRLKTGDDSSAGLWIPHRLGKVPRSARLWQTQLEPGQDCVIAIAAIDAPHWTSSQVRLRIATVTGNVNGVLAAFIIGG